MNGELRDWARQNLPHLEWADSAFIGTPRCQVAEMPHIPGGTGCALVPAMNPIAEDLRKRLKQFAVDIIRLARSMPQPDTATSIVCGQFIRSGTGTAANYRAACRARSHAEFVAKLGVAVEESDETEFWLDLVLEVPLADGPEPTRLRGEAAQVRAILKSSFDTARENRDRATPPAKKRGGRTL